MSGPEYLGGGSPDKTRQKRSFRIGLNRRQELLMDKELNDLGQRTVNEVRVRKQLEMRNNSPATDDLHRRVKEEFTSRRHPISVKRPPADISLKSKPERRGSRELAGLPPYNPLDKGNTTLTGPLRKFPYVKKDQLVPLQSLKEEAKITSMGVIPARKSSQFPELRVMMEGSSAIPLDDLTIKEMETANTAVLGPEYEEYEEMLYPDPPGAPGQEEEGETHAPLDTARSKPAILGEIGTIRQAPLVERPARPSSRGSHHTGQRASSAGTLKGSKLTESKLNLLRRIDDPGQEDGRSEGSASSIRSAQELLEEAEEITGAHKKRKVAAKKKPSKKDLLSPGKKDSPRKKKGTDDASSEATGVSGVSRGRSVDEIISSLRQQQRQGHEESMSETDKRIQEIMGRVMTRTQAVVGFSDEPDTEIMDNITEMDEDADEMGTMLDEAKVEYPTSLLENLEGTVEQEVLETERKTVTIVEPEEYGSDTATYEHPSEDVVSQKMADAQEALAKIQQELEDEKREEVDLEEEEEKGEEEEDGDLEEAQAVLRIPVEVTAEDLVGIVGTQQALKERQRPEPESARDPKPAVRTESVSFLATWQPQDQSRLVSAPSPRDRDEKSVHHFCSAPGDFQLPSHLRGLARLHHAPAKYPHSADVSLHTRFGIRQETFVSNSYRATTRQDTLTPQVQAADESRLAEAAERVMEEVGKMEPSDQDVQEWKERSEAKLVEIDIEIQGQKLDLKDDESRLFWSPAPAKLDLAPRYVKQRLFPQYKGTLGLDYQSTVAEGDEDELTDSEAGDEVDDADPLDSIRRHQLLSRRCKSTEDLTQFQYAKRERFLRSQLTTPRPATPTLLATPLSTTPAPSDVRAEEPKLSFTELRQIYSKASVPAAAVEKSELSFPPTFVRRRTHSAPCVLDVGDELQIPEDFTSAMDELTRQQQNLKRYWAREEAEPAQEELEVEMAEPEPQTNITAEILSEVPELRQKEYELSVYQRMLLRAEKKTPAELALEAGRAYVILPKKKKKSKKPADPQRLRAIDEFLAEPPRRLYRSRSYLNLDPPLPAREWRVPPQIRGVNRRGSVPDLLDFQLYATKRKAPDAIYRDPEECREWARGIWNTWFDDVFPPEVESEPEEEVATAHAQAAPEVTQAQTDEEVEAAKQKAVAEDIVELAEEIEPVFDEDEEERDVIIKILEEEIRELTKLIEGTKSPNPFHICRRGAIYKKLGKLRLAMEDLDWCLDLEPMLLDGYWHRHLLYLTQNKRKAALEDLNFLLKHNKQHAKAYKSRAELYRLQGEVTLAIMNYSQAIKLQPDDDESYFKRAEMYEARGDQLLALEDYSKTTRLRPHRTDALYKHAEYHFQNQNWSPAIQGFTEILRQEPSNSGARTFRGRAFAQLGQYNAAVQDFSAAVHLDPNNAVAFYHRACLLRKCHPQRALRDYSLSLLIDDSEDNILSYLHRGILYYELERMEDAIADFEAVTFLNKDNACAHCNLGLIYYHSESYHRAVKKFSTAIMVDPTYIKAYLCRAEAYVKLHDLKNALFDLTRAIYLQPDIPHLYMYRGFLLLQLGHLDLAAYCIRNAASMDYDVSSQSATQQAVVQAFLKNYDKVIEILKFATMQKPTGAMHVLLGKMQMKAKNFEEAVKCFENALWTMKPSHERHPWPKEAAEVYYLKGMCYEELKNNQGALDAFNKAIAANPKHAQAYYQRGLIRMKLRQSKGVQDFNRALVLNPRSFQAFLSRAAYYGMKQQYSKAVLNCNEAIRLQQNSVRAYLYRGSLKYHLKAYDLAIKDLSTAILLDNQCYLGYFNRAICYHDNKEYLKALNDYGIVLLIGDSMKVKVLINRGLLYYEFRDYGNALQDFLAAVQLKPNDRNIHHTLGLCYHRLNRLDEAVRCFTKALDLSPFFLDAYIGRGNAYMDFGTPTGLNCSRRDYQHCMLLDPACLPARVNLAYNLQMRGKMMQAWRQFSGALSINPAFVPALEGRGIVSLQMRNTFGAIQDMTAALKSGASAELYTNRGVINQYLGDRVNAMRDYQKAVTMDPRFSLAYFNAANIYFHSRQFTQAKDYYDKSLTYNPKDESAYLNRAITKVMLKDPDGALSDFRRAIKLSPRAAHVYFNRANLYASLQRYQHAERDYSTVLSLQPADLAVYRCRADVRGKLGNQAGAVADYMMIVEAGH